MRSTRICIGAALAIAVMSAGSGGVTAQDGPIAPINITGPIEFTGRLAFGPCQGATVEQLLDKTETRGEHFCRPGVVEPFSDPRLQGDYYIWPWTDMHADGPTIFATGFTIVTDDGAWRGIPDVYLQEESSGDQILIGEGSYEGLTVIATVDLDGGIWDWHGWIIEGELPPLPTEPEAIP